ncbi:MAG: tail fiber domain-containing protein, partial [Bacteroidota bacterium]
MRPLYILALSCLISNICVAQGTLWQYFNNNTYYLSGNVGLNVINPTERLQVDGNVRATAFYTPNLVFGSQTPTVPYRNAASTIGTYTDNQSLHLQSPNEIQLHAGTTKDTISTMTLLDNRVGIGTDTPERALHIRGTNDGEDDIIMDSEGGGHPNNSSALILRRSNLEQTSVNDGDLLGIINFSGYDGEEYQYSASIASFARSNYEDEVNADFRVINTYQGELHESMRVNPNGTFQIAPLIVPAGPATSDSIPSTGLVTRLTNKGGATLDHGMYLDGRQWLQATNVGNQALNYPLVLNPNGGNIGIGTDTPHVPLHIYTQSPDRGLQITTAGIQGSILLHMAAGEYGVLALGGNTKLRGNGVHSSFEGPLSIQTTTSNYSLQVNGNAGKPGSSLWIVSSDKRLKKNIKDYEDGLEQILQIRPVWYQYNGKLGLPSDKEYVGIIAQEMQEVAPYTVGAFQDEEKGEEYLDFDGGALTFMLVNAVQE